MCERVIHGGRSIRFETPSRGAIGERNHECTSEASFNSLRENVSNGRLPDRKDFFVLKQKAGLQSYIWYVAQARKLLALTAFADEVPIWTPSKKLVFPTGWVRQSHAYDQEACQAGGHHSGPLVEHSPVRFPWRGRWLLCFVLRQFARVGTLDGPGHWQPASGATCLLVG